MKKLIYCFCFLLAAIQLNGQTVLDPRVFDPVFYLKKYTDVARAYGSNNVNGARSHWQTYGMREGRQGSGQFDAKFYLKKYADIAATFGASNYQAAITHYLTNGIREGRQGFAPPKLAEGDMCWTDSYGRGAGTFPNQCGPGEEYDAGLCYPKCRSGFTGVGPMCWASCPSGYSDIGVSCSKPKAYGRGGGYPWKFGDPLNLSKAKRRCEKDHRQGCEKSGEIMYPKCRPGFHPVGCCVCSPDCPSGFRDDGAFCAKPNYGRGVGKIPTRCASGKVNQAGLCYTPCQAGYKGVGPVCWANECPSVFPVRCAAGCAKSSADCAAAIINQVTTTLEMVEAIVGIVSTGGGSTVAKRAAVTSAKTIAKSTIKQRLKKKAKEMGKNLAEATLENASNTFYEAQLTGEFSWADLDPTGIANVVLAFNKPLCKDYQ